MPLEATKNWILDLMFPKFCHGCGREGGYLCDLCRPKLLFGHPSCLGCSRFTRDGVLCAHCQKKHGIRRFLAPFSYRDPLARELIHSFKYRSAKELGDFFASEIIQFLSFYGVRIPKNALFVPIPLHRSRLAERGFNQAEKLAQALATKLETGCEELLRRTRKTEHQTKMSSHSLRRKNVARAFAIRNAEIAKDKTLILVDDVVTSGATVEEACKVVREAGAKTVWVISIAKG